MELRVKNFNSLGIHWKISLSEDRFPKKSIKSRRNCLKRGAWTVCRFKWGLVKKEGVGFFEGGGGLIPWCTLCFLDKLKGKGRPFLEGPKKGSILWDYPREHLVVIREEKITPVVKFEIILHLLSFLLHLLTNKLCRTWSFVINLWIDSRTYQK